MYNEKLEALISAALADGVLTEREKQILFKKAEAMGIDLDEFEMVLEGRLAKLQKEMAAKAPQPAEPAQQKKGIPQELDDLIQEFLTDGIISAKERQVLLNKAQSLGLNVDEVDLYIDAQQQKADQAVAAVVNKRRGKTCPYCGSSIPELTDKCPNCGGNITPEASEELEEIFTQLEDALEKFKSGSLNPKKYKAQVERYARKARMYYSNNPKVQRLLEEVEEDMQQLAKKEKQVIRNVIIGAVLIPVFCIAMGVATHFLGQLDEPKNQNHPQQENVETSNEIDSENEDAINTNGDEVNNETLTYVQETAQKVTKYLAEGNVSKAAKALIECKASNLGDENNDNLEATNLFESSLHEVIDAYSDDEKKKAQELVISCCSKYEKGKEGLRYYFLYLDSNDNLEFE